MDNNQATDFQYLNANKALTRFENCLSNQHYSHLVAIGVFQMKDLTVSDRLS